MKRNITENNRSLVLIFFIILIIPALFYQTTFAMVEVWWVNETFTHGFLVIPITLWLIWGKKVHLSKLYPAPEPLVLVITFLISCLWLISALVDVKVVMQLSMISIVLTLIWAISGRKIFFYLLFPLLFLYFAVPLGESLIPILMDFTAHTTVQLVKLTGVPVYQDGLNFILPTGNWSVAEECSGVRYLIATLTIGVVYSYLTYATVHKRLIFIAFTIIVPIFANSLRAFIIVMLGHFSGMTIATGADHLVYGWIFFGFIIFIMIFVGSFWRDNKIEFDSKAPAPDTHQLKSHTISYLTACVIVIGCFQLLYYQAQTQISQLAASAIPTTDHYGPWRQQTVSSTVWKPIYQQPDLTLSNTYTSNQGQVQLDIGYFHTQSDGSETVSKGNKLVNPYGGAWKIISSSVVVTDIFSVQETAIFNANLKLLTWQWYRVGKFQTYNPFIAKIYEAYTRLISGRTDGAYITLSTPLDEDKASARNRLSSFFNESIDTLNTQLEDLR